MNLRKISFENFKCLYNTSFEPGKVNIFIGANGSGKSTILEAVGLLSAAMTDRVDSMSLQRRGVRLSVPALYRSCFKNPSRQKPTVALSMEWDDDNDSDIFRYDVDLIPPTDSDYWKYSTKMVVRYGTETELLNSRQPATLGSFRLTIVKTWHLDAISLSRSHHMESFSPIL